MSTFQLTRSGFIPASAYGVELAAAFGDLLDDAARIAQEKLDEFDRTIEAIKRDNRLTQRGKSDNAQAATTQVATDIEAMVTRKMNAVQAKIDVVREGAPEDVPLPRMIPAKRSALGITTGEEWVSTQSRATEIRAAVARLNSSDAWATIQGAIRTGDGEVAYAVATAPLFIRRQWAKDKDVEAEVAEFLRRQDPAKYAVLDTALLARTSLLGVQTQARAAIESMLSGQGFVGLRLTGPDPAKKLTSDGTYVPVFPAA